MFSSGEFSSAAGLSLPAGVSPQKKQREQIQQVCVPVTARILESLPARDVSEEIRIHGKEVDMIILVGVVESLRSGNACLEFVLNDGTGKVNVKHYMTESHHIVNGLLEGQYAHVVGSLRVNPVMHVSAQFFSPITSADAISYHMIEVGYAALKLRTKAEPKTPATKRSIETKGTLMQEDVTVSPFKETKIVQSQEVSEGLRAKLLLHLSREAEPSARPEGLSTATVVKHFGEFQKQDVLKCLQDLVNEGEIFNTIDDDHFGAL